MKNPLEQRIEEYFNLRNRMKELQKKRSLTNEELLMLRMESFRVNEYYGVSGSLQEKEKK